MKSFFCNLAALSFFFSPAVCAQANTINPDANGVYNLRPEPAVLEGGTRKETDHKEPKIFLGYWDKAGAKVSWTINVQRAGSYRLDMSYFVIQNAGYQFSFTIGKAQFNWTSFDQRPNFTFKPFPIREISLDKGSQVISLTLKDNVLEKQTKGAILISNIRLTPIINDLEKEEITQHYTPDLEPIEKIEIEILRDRIAKQLIKQSEKLKSEYVEKLNAAKRSYHEKNKPLTVAVIDAIIQNIDKPDVLNIIQNSIIKTDQTAEKPQKELKIDKRFIVGRWKQEDSTNEYVFGAQGRLAYYEDAKRNNKVVEKGYYYSEGTNSFSLESDSGSYLASIKIIDQNTITIRSKKFKRVVKD